MTSMVRDENGFHVDLTTLYGLKAAGPTLREALAQVAGHMIDNDIKGRTVVHVTGHPKVSTFTLQVDTDEAVLAA